MEFLMSETKVYAILTAGYDRKERMEGRILGELLGIPEEEYPDGYIYCGDTPAETFRDFLDAVYVYELVQERDRNPIEVEPLSEEEVEDMYCKFLKRIKEIEKEMGASLDK
jgi:predicted nucleotidyltransferase